MPPSVIWGLLVSSLLLGACSSGSAQPVASARAPIASSPSPGVATVTKPRAVASNLRAPWGVALLPDGSALVTERDTGWVWRVRKDAAAGRVSRIAGVAHGGEGGLLGIAVSQQFAADGYVFIYHTAHSDNRVVRYRLANGRLSGRKVILSGIPKGPIHNGGRLAFGPDGYLYVGTGDAATRSRAQQWESLGGKILRITKSGRAPAGNPRKGSPVWSLGHRNVQGLAWDNRGRMFASEFGQDTWDELNLIRKGRDYGWPAVEGKAGRFTDPLVVWRPAEASPSGIAIAGNFVYVAALRGESLWRVPLTATGVGEPRRMLRGKYGRLRAVAVDRAGDFWLLNSNISRGTPISNDDRVLVLPKP